MEIYSKIDKGVIRHSNQDAYFAGEISPDTTFAVVCDGMGGAKAGNVASETAVKTISEYIIKELLGGTTKHKNDVKKITPYFKMSELSFDELCEKTGMKPAELSAALIKMEMFGLVVKGNGNLYYKI